MKCLKMLITPAIVCFAALKLCGMEVEQPLIEKRVCYIRTSDDKRLEVPFSLAKQFKALAHQIEDFGAKAFETQEIEVPYTTEVVKDIIGLAALYLQDQKTEKVFAALDSVALPFLVDIILALNYLDHEALSQVLELFARKLHEQRYEDSAVHRKFIEELELQVPPELMNRIKSHLIYDHKDVKDLALQLKATLTLEQKSIKMNLFGSSINKNADGTFIVIESAVYPGRLTFYESCSLIDMRGDIPKKVHEFVGDPYNIWFSPDGKYIYSSYRSLAESHMSHRITLIELETLKEQIIECPSIEYTNYVHNFSSDSCSLLLGEYVYDVKTGMQRKSSDSVPYNKIVKKDGKTDIHFSKNNEHELPDGMWPYTHSEGYVWLGNTPDSHIIKMLPNGSVKTLYLPEIPSGTVRSFVYSKTGKLLARIVKLPGEYSQIQVYDVTSLEHPQEIFSCPVAPEAMKEIKFAEDGSLCMVVANDDIFVIDTRTKLVKSIRKPPLTSSYAEVEFNRRNDRAIVCFGSCSAYLFSHLNGIEPLKVLEICPRVPSDNKKFTAFFAGPADDSFCTVESFECTERSTSERLPGGGTLLNYGNEYLMRQAPEIKLWNLHTDTLTKCSLAQIFMMIKCLKNPALWHESYNDSLYGSLDEAMKKVFSAALDGKKADVVVIEKSAEEKASEEAYFKQLEKKHTGYRYFGGSYFDTDINILPAAPDFFKYGVSSNLDTSSITASSSDLSSSSPSSSSTVGSRFNQNKIFKGSVHSPHDEAKPAEFENIKPNDEAFKFLIKSILDSGRSHEKKEKSEVGKKENDEGFGTNTPTVSSDPVNGITGSESALQSNPHSEEFKRKVKELAESIRRKMKEQDKSHRKNEESKATPAKQNDDDLDDDL